jgi:hypothetical protein
LRDAWRLTHSETGENTMMDGIDPYAVMVTIAGELDRLTEHDEIVAALDEIEYLFEILPPEMQDSAEQLIHRLRYKLEQTSE